MYIMLFISCFVLFISELRNSVSTYAPNEGKTKVAINLPLKKTQCPTSCSRSLLFVSTVDGMLTCLNAKNGKWMWAFDLKQPLLSSSISSIKIGADLSQAHFIPSLDGTLFKWNGKYVESLALSTDFLLGQMKKLPGGSFVVGGTNIAIYGIDMYTGKVLYESSGRGCKPTRKGNINNRDVISLRRSQHVVRAVNRATGHENWNYSVGKYEMELAEDDFDFNINTLCDGDLIDLHFSVQDGIISNTASSSSWSFKVNSPITDVWHLDNNSLKSVDIFKFGLFENIEGFPGADFQKQSYMFLGVHEGQMYIQKASGNHQRHRLHGYEKPEELEVDLSQWRPFISTSASRTPTLNNKQLTALRSLDYPFDNGFVLISNLTPTAMGIVSDDIESDGICDIDGNNCEFAHVPETPLIETVPLTVKDWWKEILILSILIAVGINVGVKFVKRKFRIKHRKPSMSSHDIHLNATKEKSEVKAKRSKVSSVSKTESTKVASERTSSVSPGYDSRYIDDFEHVECLGKGGFGVVFKAKKKIDDREYAIKRIYLPNCEEAKSKMMREVKALAALDHSGIVRYFHAWWEKPPQDWQKTTDKTYLMKDYLNTTSYALSQDWVLELEEILGNDSQSMSTPSIPEKRKSDDPLGKRFNFDTGIEEIISDHKEFDLLKHNDVFYSDDEESILFSNENVNKEQNEDSFDIVFESNCDSDSFVHLPQCSESSRSNNLDNNRRKILTEQDETDINKNNSEHLTNELKKHSSRKKRTKRRLVGKCCALDSSCLTQPPLFLYIQMQLCKRETLRDWLKSKTDGIHLKESMGVFMQIVDAVEYFHNLGLMHRDLKPANILFSLDGSVKVGDFGLVTAITRPSIGKHQGKSLEDENHTGQVGTQLYMSPEQASGNPYCHKVDIFSLGLIFFELICSFSTQMERMQVDVLMVIYRLKQGILSDDLLSTPQGKLVQILTAENPDLRPEARGIKNHMFITEIKNNIANETNKVAATSNTSSGLSESHVS